MLSILSKSDIPGTRVRKVWREKGWYTLNSVKQHQVITLTTKEVIRLQSVYTKEMSTCCMYNVILTNLHTHKTHTHTHTHTYDISTPTYIFDTTKICTYIPMYECMYMYVCIYEDYSLVIDDSLSPFFCLQFSSGHFH